MTRRGGKREVAKKGGERTCRPEKLAIIIYAIRKKQDKEGVTGGKGQKAKRKKKKPMDKIPRTSRTRDTRGTQNKIISLKERD